MRLALPVDLSGGQSGSKSRISFLKLFSIGRAGCWRRKQAEASFQLDHVPKLITIKVKNQQRKGHIMLRTNIFDLFWSQLPWDTQRSDDFRYPAGNDIDLEDLGNSFLLTADLPGVGPNDLQVEVDDNVLTVKAECKLEKNHGKFLVKRRSRMSFEQKVTLSDNIDQESIAATIKNGVLEVLLPKKDKERPRQIEVKNLGE